MYPTKFMAPIEPEFDGVSENVTRPVASGEATEPVVIVCAANVFPPAFRSKMVPVVDNVAPETLRMPAIESWPPAIP